jgi:adenylosuccinate synthase
LNDAGDPLRIVILSGPVSSGKTTLAEKLRTNHGARVVKTRDLILQQLRNIDEERGALQRAGERLDRADGGQWVKNALVRFIEDDQQGETPTGLYLVDSVRIPGQVAAIREAFGSAVHHIHLTAPDDELETRYSRRGSKTEEFHSYAELRRSRTEKSIGRLAELADTVVATERCTDEGVLVRATALLGLYPRRTTPLVDVLVGGQYGSEGKGNIVGHIAPEYELLVRVGGPNAGHKVYAEPRSEVYHHLPSGTRRAARAELLLGAGAVIYPKLIRPQ